MKTIRYFNLDCVELTNETLSLLVTQTVGPRIISLRHKGGKNLFAELPDTITQTPAGIYHFYGGHRLWRAPEDLSLTYFIDNDPVEITETENGLRVIQPVEPPTGLQKSLDLILTGSTVTIHHHLTNHGSAPITCAPWALTQLRPGGVAVLPQSTTATGLLPNRQISLWPYTDIRSPHITWGNQYVFIHANVTTGALKVGFPNPRGWLAYWLDGTLFVKKVTFEPIALYPDQGSSSESYCNDKFIELETLAPLTHILPSRTVTHTETWEVYGNVDFSANEEATQALVEKLGLD